MIWLVLRHCEAAGYFEGTRGWLQPMPPRKSWFGISRNLPRSRATKLPCSIDFEACGGLGRGLTLVRCRKGSANLRVTVEGRGAHAGSGHREGSNAIVEMARLVEHMAEMTDYSRDLTVNVGSIAGGGPSKREPHQAECSVNIRAFDESVLQSAIDAIFSLRDGPAAVRAESDGFSCRISVELLSHWGKWKEVMSLDGWEGIGFYCECAVDSEERFLPSLDGLGPFGLRGHSSERSSDGSKVPEYVAASSFLETGAINVAAIRELMSA